MIEVTAAMKKELGMLEDLLEDGIRNFLPSFFADMVINSPMYEKYRDKALDAITGFMDSETGEVDGASVRRLLSSMYPIATQWVSVPARNFKITDEIDSVMKMLVGKGMM